MRSQPPAVELLGGGLLETSFTAVFYGTIRCGLDRRSGVTTRAVLASHRGPVLLAKVVTAVLAGAAIGVVGGATMADMLGMTLPVVSPNGSLPPVLLGGTAASAATAVWGLMFGLLVRNDFLAPAAALLLWLAVPGQTARWSMCRRDLDL